MTLSIVYFLVALSNICAIVANGGAYVGPFQSGHWIPDTTEAARDPRSFHVQQHPQLSTKFIVALKHRDVDMLKKELLAVSMPRSGSYGKHLSVSQIRAKYAPKEHDLEKVVSFFKEIPGAIVELNKVGSMLQVKAPLQSIEKYLNTKLAWFRHVDEATPKRSLRAISSLDIPAEIQDMIAFVSLNSPVSHNVKPKRMKSKVPKSMTDILNNPQSVNDMNVNSMNFNLNKKLNEEQDMNRKIVERNVLSSFEENSLDSQPAQRHVYVTEGNKEVMGRNLDVLSSKN